MQNNNPCKINSDSNPPLLMTVVFEDLVEQSKERKPKKLILDKHTSKLAVVNDQDRNDKGREESIPDSLKKLIDICNDLPEDKQSELMSELVSVAEEFRKRAKCNIPVLPEKPSKKQMYSPGSDLMEHLKEAWGIYLKKYNDDLEEDILFQDYLWKHDPVFMKKLYDRLMYLHRKDKSNPRPGDVIKRRTDRVSMEIENYSREKEKEYRRVYSAKVRRKHKASNSDTTTVDIG